MKWPSTPQRLQLAETVALVATVIAYALTMLAIDGPAASGFGGSAERQGLLTVARLKGAPVEAVEHQAQKPLRKQLWKDHTRPGASTWPVTARSGNRSTWFFCGRDKDFAAATSGGAVDRGLLGGRVEQATHNAG